MSIQSSLINTRVHVNFKNEDKDEIINYEGTVVAVERNVGDNHFIILIMDDKGKIYVAEHNNCIVLIKSKHNKTIINRYELLDLEED